MKKTFIILALFVFNFMIIGTIYSSGNSTSKEVKLIIKGKPTRDLFSAPDINAYLADSYLEIVFNESILGNVNIVITANDNEILYSEIIQVNSPMNWPVYLDLDERNSYSIEISSKGWLLIGDF